MKIFDFLFSSFSVYRKQRKIKWYYVTPKPMPYINVWLPEYKINKTDLKYYVIWKEE